jgi:prepilin-type processing-associated H-X9-DG protein
MTRSVLTGPPSRRGLAWGVAVLVGAAVLLSTPDGSGVAAKDEPAKAALPADLALVPGDAFAFATIRVGDLWNHEGTKALRADVAREFPDAYKEMEKMAGVPPAEIERLTFVITKTPGPGDQGPVFAIVVATGKPYDKKKLLESLVPDAKEETHKGKTLHVLGGAAVCPIDATTFLMGATDVVQDVIDRGGKSADSPLAPALALAAGKHPVTGGIRPAALLDTIGNMIPGEVEAFKPLLELPAAYGTIDFGKEATLEARLVSAGETEAKGTVTAAKSLVALIQQLGFPQAEAELDKIPKGKADNFKKLFKEFTMAVKDLPIEAKGKEVPLKLTLKADLPALTKALREGVVVARGAAGRVQSSNNLKQMAIAMHNYHSTYNAFPPAAITGKDDKPLLSWRVAILPFVEQDALYNEFKLDEPWDSANNKKLLEKMPRVYMTPEQAEKADEKGEKVTTTHYRVFHGKGAAFEGTSGQPIATFTDGTSNTILIVEAEQAVPWTKPEELPFDPKKDLPKLGLKGAEKVNVAMADGSVRELQKEIKKDELTPLITRNAGD